jgi:hypothetical protein
MRQLKIDFSELELAFDNSGGMISSYLDVETGEIIHVTDEERSIIEIIYETYYDETSQTVDWEAAFLEEGIPDWQRDRLKDVDRVEAGYGNRFITIPSEDSREGYHDMEAFIDTVHNPRLQERLERAISGRGAFRYFKDVLLDYPTERDRWFKFKNDRLHQRIFDWLEAQGIIPC